VDISPYTLQSAPDYPELDRGTSKAAPGMTGTIPPISGNKIILQADSRDQRSALEIQSCLTRARFVDME
jgi:hypothetical protein